MDFRFFITQGFQHVLDINGYDHVLFLTALVVIFQIQHWKKVLWLTTLFTVGHMVGLFLTAYEVLFIPRNIVEFLIPVTILITAVLNIIQARKPAKTNHANLWFALFFGLIHGIGFTSYFSMLAAGNDSILFPLITFSLGVELAQIVISLAVLILGFILLRIFNKARRDWIIVVSSIIIGVLLPILIESYGNL